MKDIADSRAEIDQARLLTLQVRACDMRVALAQHVHVVVGLESARRREFGLSQAAAMMDLVGNKVAGQQIALIKVFHCVTRLAVSICWSMGWSDWFAVHNHDCLMFAAVCRW